jgi:non-homologous end joining protein Ku
MEMHGPDWLHLTNNERRARSFGYQWSWRFRPLISYKKSVFALMQVKRMAAPKSSDLPCIFAESEGLVLSILRYADELRDFTPYFEGINAKAEPEAVGLAKELIEAESGPFEPQKMRDKYAETLRELLRAKVEQRAPQIEVATEGKAPKEVINIMAALKESMQTKERSRVRDAVRRRMGKPTDAAEARPRSSRARPSLRRTAH